MTNQDTSRRYLLRIAATGAAATAIAISTGEAMAYQGNMERALGALNDALGSLQGATPNKGGHRERAIQLVEAAMRQVEAGIQFANEHGGG
jgi:hypothetical protein